MDKAFNLIQASGLRKDDQNILRKHAHLKAVFIHLANSDFESARNSIEESDIDLREV